MQWYRLTVVFFEIDGLTMQYFIKFSYFGWMFSGYQRGNGRSSVEDSIAYILKREKITQFLTAARTDRGVSAVSNVLSVKYDENIRKLLASMNSNESDIIFHSYAAVDDDAKVRHCTEKMYRYIVSSGSVNKIRDKLALFQGTHNFSNFSRKDIRNPVRTINRIDVSESASCIFVDFYARSFVWNQIRRIMGYILHDDAISDPFGGKVYGMTAPAENLILIDIRYEGIDFHTFLTRGMIRHANQMILRGTVLREVSSHLAESGS